MELKTPRWLGRRENSSKAADQDNALIDTPEHSDVVERTTTCWPTREARDPPGASGAFSEGRRTRNKRPQRARTVGGRPASPSDWSGTYLTKADSRRR